MPSITSEATFDLGGLTDPLKFCGHRDQNLNALEALIPVVLRLDGDRVHVSGDRSAVQHAQDVLGSMLSAARRGTQVTPDDVALAVRGAHAGTNDGGNGIPQTLATSARGREIRPKTAGQRALVAAVDANTLTFAIGSAGTGKTFLAIVMAVRALKRREIARIVLSRPAVEAGEKLGFLPGDLREKVDPYLRPLYDALAEMLEDGTTQKYLERGTIEVAPLAYMRGRTLSDAFVILDEAQNTSPEQLKMFLTRLGANSKMIVTGDDTQIDLPRGQRSGLLDAERLFTGVDDIALVRLDEADVVRHPLVGRIVAAYDRASVERAAAAAAVRDLSR
ncbi:PhoH-like protein [Vulcanimicrobium alpinum]|uniref:PhoH-like protein n=1 Tax=Vulcanimicrobium alpinum TaxID=3016050 RepID=A0AAN1XWN3_UNVUL|nr:PhoH family protein [Vulcanimicrobium alpinum]BDE06355.1 PhoH-like protein [Vulcanimicrobium alpinum]